MEKLYKFAALSLKHGMKLIGIVFIGLFVFFLYGNQHLESFKYSFKSIDPNYLGTNISNGTFTVRIFATSPHTSLRKDKYILDNFDIEYKSNMLTYTMQTISSDIPNEKNMNRSNTSEEKPICPEVPPGLLGRIPKKRLYKNPTNWTDIVNANPRVLEGGRYSPKDCTARSRVAIIIALRNREAQLQSLLEHMHPIWQRQQIDYTVFTITHVDNELFNRAKLMNVGFAEARKDRKYDCFVFHDVDLMVEDDRCLYWCLEDNPRHMAAYMDKFRYKKITYNFICPLEKHSGTMIYFGGVSMMTAKQMHDANGFSNIYWGWGGEDDDIYLRLWKKGYKIENPYGRKCVYHMIKHEHETTNAKNPGRIVLLGDALSRMDEEGLNNLRYKVIALEKSALYTNVTVDLGHPVQKLKDFMSENWKNKTRKENCDATMPWDKP